MQWIYVTSQTMQNLHVSDYLHPHMWPFRCCVWLAVRTLCKHNRERETFENEGCPFCSRSCVNLCALLFFLILAKYGVNQVRTYIIYIMYCASRPFMIYIYIYRERERESLTILDGVVLNLGVVMCNVCDHCVCVCVCMHVTSAKTVLWFFWASF